MSDINNGGSPTCVGNRGMWEVFVFSPRFYCKPKTALKK